MNDRQVATIKKVLSQGTTGEQTVMMDVIINALKGRKLGSKITASDITANTELNELFLKAVGPAQEVTQITDVVVAEKTMDDVDLTLPLVEGAEVVIGPEAEKIATMEIVAPVEVTMAGQTQTSAINFNKKVGRPRKASEDVVSFILAELAKKTKQKNILIQVEDIYGVKISQGLIPQIAKTVSAPLNLMATC